MKLSATALTNKFLRQAGHRSGTVECWIPGARIRRDLFHIIDIVCLQSSRIYGIQATTWANLTARCNKALSDDLVQGLRDWMTCGGIFQVWGWRKVKKTERDQIPSQYKFVCKVKQACITLEQEIIFREIDQKII